MTTTDDPNAKTWHNDTGKPIYRTADDRLVDADDPDAAFLVAGVDGTIARDIAEKYELTGEKAESRGRKGESESGGRRKRRRARRRIRVQRRRRRSRRRRDATQPLTSSVSTSRKSPIWASSA